MTPRLGRRPFDDATFPACLQEIVLHVIVGAACHAGHLDVSREVIDGRSWFVIEQVVRQRVRSR
jgi:hypothetical protein